MNRPSFQRQINNRTPLDLGEESIEAWLRAQPLPQRLQRSAEAIDQAIAEERAAWDGSVSTAAS